jgi:hypothetical protein
MANPLSSDPPTHYRLGALHVWRNLKKAEFYYPETQRQTQDSLENTFGAIYLLCGSNSNPTMEQFVDALKANIISAPAFRGLHGTNCKEDDASFLDNLHSLLKVPNAFPTDPFTNHIREIPDNINNSSSVA